MMKLPGVPARWLSVLVLFVTFFAAQTGFAQPLDLNVNRNTGVTTISNPTGAAIAINGYSILSSFGALRPGPGPIADNWNSLDDQNVGTGEWFEAAPVATDLSELNGLGSSSVAASGASPLALGAPYTKNFVPAFGVDPDHLTFEYNEFGGTATVAGNVVYSGTKQVNDLILQVNTTNGQVQLKNDSPYDIFIDGYAVKSANGSLQSAQGKWFSFQDRGLPGWLEASPTEFVVSEAKDPGSIRLTAGSGYSLGELFFTGGTPELTFEFLEPGKEVTTAGQVVYSAAAFPAVAAPTPGVLGDFDENGIVDARDYVKWRDNVGTATLFRNDPVGGVIGTGQYNVWRSNFGNTTAGAAGQVLVGVPEPASVVLLILAMFAIVGPMHRYGRE